MKRFLLPVILVCCCLHVATAQTPNHVWAKQFGFGADFFAEPRDIISDASGAVYVTGTFADTNDFDPGPGVYNLIAAAGADIFIMKLDVNGNLIWAKQIAGPVGDDVATSIALDKEGNPFITGYFYGAVDFDPGIGEHLLSADANHFSDAFILKLDADGNFIWVKQVGGDAYDGAFKIDLDEDDNILVCGHFAVAADFDPGPLQYILTGISLYADNFILKLTHDGDFVWVKQVSGPTSFSGAYNNKLAIDKNNNIILAGNFGSGSCDFDPGDGVANLNSMDGNTGYILKLDPNGIFKWVKSFAGTNAGASIRTISVADNAIYCAGFFNDTIDFDPGAGTYQLSSPSETGMAVKLDSNGNFIWANPLPYRVTSSSVGMNGSLYTAGDFGSTRGLTKFDGAGNVQWENIWNGSSYCAFTALYVDSLTNIYGAGIFSNISDFDPGPGTATMSPVEMSDIFVHKLNDFTTAPLKFLSFSGQNHGNSNILNWQVNNSLLDNGRFQIQQSNDGVSFIAAGGFDLDKNKSSYTFLHTDIHTGIVYYRIKYTGDNGKAIFSGVIAVKNIELTNGGIKIWPVPASGLINIKTAIAYSDANIRLFDITGKLVFSKTNCNGNFFKVELEKLPGGAYTLSIADKEKRQQVQIIK